MVLWHEECIARVVNVCAKGRKGGSKPTLAKTTSALFIQGLGFRVQVFRV